MILVHDFVGMQVRTVNRLGSQLLGANGRDDGALVSNLPFFHILMCLLILWSMKILMYVSFSFLLFPFSLVYIN